MPDESTGHGMTQRDIGYLFGKMESVEQTLTNLQDLIEKHSAEEMRVFQDHFGRLETMNQVHMDYHIQNESSWGTMARMRKNPIKASLVSIGLFTALVSLHPGIFGPIGFSLKAMVQKLF